MIGSLAVINVIRNAGDPDFDTFSEQVRRAKDAVPYGDHLLAAGLVTAGVGFWRHICRPRWGAHRLTISPTKEIA